MQKIDLSQTGLIERDLKNILKGIKEFPEIEKAILFGSRAKGNYKTGSDVDIAIYGERVTYTTAVRLSSMLNEELPLPYFFDILDYAAIGEPRLRDHIDRVGVLIFQRD